MNKLIESALQIVGIIAIAKVAESAYSGMLQDSIRRAFVKREEESTEKNAYEILKEEEAKLDAMVSSEIYSEEEVATQRKVVEATETALIALLT